MTSKPDLTTTAGRIEDLRNRLAESQAPVGQDVACAARTRIEQLMDQGTFVETDALARHRVEAYKMYRTKPATDGVVTGYGLIDGRRVCVFSQDSTIFDGAIGEVYAEKMLKIYELAMKTGVPVVGIYDSAGPRWQEGIVTAHMQAKILRAASVASGLIPQVAVVAGQTNSLAATTVPLADVTVMVEGASLQLAGAAVAAAAHGAETGLAHLTAADDAEALDRVRTLLSYLPLNNQAGSPLGMQPRTTVEPTPANLDEFMPDDDDAAYDAAEIIASVTDGDFFELSGSYAPNVITGFSHIGGRAVGIVATQPNVDQGRLSNAAARKAARFIRTCDAFNIPVLQFLDCPGFVEGDAEACAPAGAAALAYAFAEAQVGTVTVITRKALGAAYTLLGSKGLGADLVYAWPTAQIALADAATAATQIGTDAAEYEAENLNPYVATERGLVDAVIEPSQTRHQVLEGLRLLERKVVYPTPKKHGNIPL
ncbi:acyl-CoA carboxylase subunit beta [Corynebacterium sp. TA-R-1]|uniref:Acyl-CoA carboxylase subunit beta n=1 Tax=Corynebacterium stercoris TaxID=2943490 RepID=A0ABT1G1U4_9CORY|nr:carboxyl transferase domain-containing protein [Corynebacterium stercoris]MCP1387998.1 acyl-CoA carboxylase subunit beta [Corynebacterium stercoris]